MSLVIKRNDGQQPDEPTSDRTRQPMHLLPCKVRPRKLAAKKQTTFSAPVDRYFCPYKVPTSDGQNDGNAVWHASFRGKPLTGAELDMPDGYVGILCHRKSDQADSADLTADDANGEVTQQLMYWNWDRVPTREDPLLAAFDWIRVSEAMA